METSGVAYGHILKEQILDFPGKINGCPSSPAKRIAPAGSMGARHTDAAARMTAKPRGWPCGAHGVPQGHRGWGGSLCGT